MKKELVIIGAVAAVVLALALLASGCFSTETKAEIRAKAHAAIISYVEDQGAEKADDYIDQLVADGKLGAANAEKLKAALPLGIEKLKETMKEEDVK